MLETLFLLPGILVGVLTGLIPGLHPNTVVFTSLPFYLSFDIGFWIYSSFIIGLSVSHTFNDFIPAIFLGAPEAEAALSSPPGAEMALEGKGLEAFKYTAYGGIVSIAALLFVLPLVWVAANRFYPIFESFLPFVLGFFLLFIVFHSPNVKHSATIAALSGVLGILVFEAPIRSHNSLIPVFTGLFAAPALLKAYREDLDLPEQEEADVDRYDAGKGGITGLVAGLMAGIVPGIGAATATSFLAPMLDSSRRRFLASMGAVNTSDIVVSFLALYLIGSPRSGASVAVQAIKQVGVNETFLLMALAVVATLVSFPLAILTARRAVKFLSNVNFDMVSVVVFAVIVSIVLFLTSFTGFLVFLTSACIGILAQRWDQRRACMSVLIVPVLITFLGGLGIFM
jgi:putative membrane protein